MARNRSLFLIILLLLTLFWALPASALVIQGPVLSRAETGWGEFGLVIRAEADVMLLSVEFPNRGLADVILLRRSSDRTVLASVPVPAGNSDAIVNINCPLSANETYELVATTSNNRFYGSLGGLIFPVGNSELTVLSSYLEKLPSYLGAPYYSYWLSFNNITTEPLQPEMIEAVIDIKPGSDINPINLKSKGLVPVAILTTDDLDALAVDLNSVVFAGATPVKWEVQDINGDGRDDILLYFKTTELSDLSSSSTEAVLTGVTLDSIPISGKDSVIIVPQK